MRCLGQYRVAGEQRVGQGTDQPAGPRRKDSLIFRAPEGCHQRASIQNVNHARFERIALRTFSLVAGGASVLTLPNKSSHGEPCLAWTACTRCRTAFRANSLKSSPTAAATFCQVSFSRTGTRTVSVSLISRVYHNRHQGSSAPALI